MLKYISIVRGFRKLSPAVDFSYKSTAFIQTSSQVKCNMSLLQLCLFVCVSCVFYVTVYTKAYNGKPCDCGHENTAGRVIGGSPAKANRYPWMVGIMVPQPEGGFNICGGSLINERYVLTAAHCVLSPLILEANLVFGAHSRDDVFGTSLSRPISGVNVHELYNKQGKSRHDIALIRLKDRIEFTDKIRPICLAEETNIESLVNNLFLTGWGVTERNDLGEELLEADVPVVSDSVCAASRHADWLDLNFQICAGVAGKGMCTGDSGGPLATRTDGRVVQVGIVSYGVNCGRSGVPSVYTRVSGYIEWIKNITRDAQYCI